jgi:hypothetical protein
MHSVITFFLFLHRRQMPNTFSAHLFSTPQHITYNHLHSMIVHANQSQHLINTNTTRNVIGMWCSTWPRHTRNAKYCWC